MTLFGMENMWHIHIIIMPCCLLMLNILYDFLKNRIVLSKFNNLTVKIGHDQIFRTYYIDTNERK